MLHKLLFNASCIVAAISSAEAPEAAIASAIHRAISAAAFGLLAMALANVAFRTLLISSAKNNFKKKRKDQNH